MTFLQEIEQSIDSDTTATGQLGKKINENIRDRAIQCNPKTAPSQRMVMSVRCLYTVESLLTAK